MFKQRLLTFACIFVLTAIFVAPFSTSPAYAGAVITNSGSEKDSTVTTSPADWPAARTTLPIRGADISSLKKSEDFGGIYRTEAGKERDALRILSSYGMNWARLRVWVDPADGYHDKDELLLMASRLKKNDMQLLVDLHYSDTWADPGHQTKPAAWQNYTVDQL